MRRNVKVRMFKPAKPIFSSKVLLLKLILKLFLFLRLFLMLDLACINILNVQIVFLIDNKNVNRFKKEKMIKPMNCNEFNQPFSNAKKKLSLNS